MMAEYNFNNLTFNPPACGFVGHRWVAQERGHKCANCGMEEFIDPMFGGKVVLDPSMPKGEIHFRDPVTDRLAGKITGL
jgi:hypothetical protein